MPRYEDRYGTTTRLYVGHLSSRTRSRDLEHIFSRYGRFPPLPDLVVNGGRWTMPDLVVNGEREFSDPRDADDARYNLDGRDVAGRRIIVEFAKGVPRGPGGVREYVGRGPAPGSGRCFNCGIDGHWARDCKAGDWKNKCYRCGERGHIERNCQNSPKKLSRSRSPPTRRGRDAEYKERRSVSPRDESPEPKRSASPSKTRKLSPTPDRDDSRKRSPSPARGRMETDQDGYSDSPKETSRSPVSPSTGRYDESPYAANGRNRSPSPREDRSPVDDDDPVRSPRGSESP
ncbi:hypothetical protein DH2020_017872 [Rehmannia glutinosa]|uniref:Uncharacterized protein n=1 Tax=Rehmannia glutinosa TaxID=99300 RepID=A0ABR0WIG2_REHGL